ncbi:MAG: exodeoxyribonuclease III [Coriobacteriales bacterium]|jgi:exodeoxyribonuclease-3|nr:exodeoxyribonuclease III [Coriobacteriales bacterium]
MRCVSWNVNGLRAVLKKDFLNIFAGLDADIFAIQETKLKEGQVELALADDYQQVWSFAERPGYSGTAVFYRPTVVGEPLQVVHSLEISEEDIASARAFDAEHFEGRNFAAYEAGEHYTDKSAAGLASEADDLRQSDLEGRLCALEFADFWFVTCYTPNSKDGLARIAARLVWGAAFRRLLTGLADGSAPATQVRGAKPVIACGDLNVAHEEIDLKNDKTNHGNAGFSDEERADFGCLLEAGFTDSFRFLYPDKVAYSWWSYRNNARKNDAGWRIDYFLTSNDLRPRIREAEILGDVYGSDHCPIMLELD